MIIADLRRNLATLRRPRYSAMVIWMVVLPTGRIARHLLLGLHVTDLQSPLLRLPPCSRIHPARRRFDFLLLDHLLLHHSIFQGDNATDHDHRWQSAF